MARFSELGDNVEELVKGAILGALDGRGFQPGMVEKWIATVPVHHGAKCFPAAGGVRAFTLALLAFLTRPRRPFSTAALYRFPCSPAP